MTPRGEGIAKIKGFPVFICNAKPKEHLKIKITEIWQRLRRRRNSAILQQLTTVGKLYFFEAQNDF